MSRWNQYKRLWMPKALVLLNIWKFASWRCADTWKIAQFHLDGSLVYIIEWKYREIIPFSLLHKQAKQMRTKKNRCALKWKEIRNNSNKKKSIEWMVWYGFNLYARTEYSKVKQKSITLDKNTFFKKKTLSR